MSALFPEPSAAWQIKDGGHRAHMSNMGEALLEICEIYWVIESTDWWFVAQVGAEHHHMCTAALCVFLKEDESDNYRCVRVVVCSMQTVRSAPRALNLMAFSSTLNCKMEHM